MSFLIATSIFTLGRKSTTYSAPRYSSVCPFCRPNPFTSVTVMPCTPIAERASRTSSSLNGLMMAANSFMFLLLVRRPSERIAHECHEPVLRPVLPLYGVERFLGIGAFYIAADVPVVAEV